MWWRVCVSGDRPHSSLGARPLHHQELAAASQSQTVKNTVNFLAPFSSLFRSVITLMSPWTKRSASLMQKGKQFASVFLVEGFGGPRFEGEGGRELAGKGVVLGVMKCAEVPRARFVFTR